MDIQMQQAQGRIAGASLGNSDAYYAKQAQNACAGQIQQQSEIERETDKLRSTAEALEMVVGKLLGSIEKVTRTEPQSPSGELKGGLAPVAATILGRNMDSINGQLRQSINILQSTIQRIEL